MDFRTVQCTLRSVASVALPDLGPWDPGWEFSSQEALAQTLLSSLTIDGWADVVRRVVIFIMHHTQQAVTAAAAESARAWRTWAKEACQGSADAGHAFSKADIDDGDFSGLAGPELLVKQMGTWLPLWLDGRRANAKQLGDQEDWGEPLPRPTLEEVDAVCKTYKSTAGLGHDCINRKAILQLPVELRARFIDLLMAFEASCVKPFCWAHMMVLRPKPSGGHRTIGLTVAPLRVLSRLRRPVASSGRTTTTQPTSGAAKAKRATGQHGPTRYWWLQQRGGSSRRPLSCSAWRSSTNMSGTTTLACWCASYEGWRFLEADKCHLSLLGLRDHPPRLQRGHDSCLTHSGNSPGNCFFPAPVDRLWNVVDDILGHVAGTDRMVQAITAEAARLLVEGLQARDLPLSKRKSKVLIDGSDKLKQALLRQLEAQGIDETAAARNVGADLLQGKRRRAHVVEGRLTKAARRVPSRPPLIPNSCIF